MAAGSHVAFLNHDDAWLPDHLERALAVLGCSGGDFYVGRSAFARRSLLDDGHEVVPLFTEVNPAARQARDAFVGHPVLFEPASSWVVAADVAQRTGPWRSARSMYRTPAQEWVMRAWRRGARFAFGDPVTVLKIVTHHQYESAAGNYAMESREHRRVASLLAGRSPDQVRELVAGQMDDGVHQRAAQQPLDAAVLAVTSG